VGSPSSTGTETADAVAIDRSRKHRLRWLLAVGAVVVSGLAAVVIADPFANTAPTKGIADNADPTSLSTVSRQDLSEQTQVSATLGYAGDYGVVNQAQGTITSLPSVGALISQGQAFYEVNGQPVVLLYGFTPAYRTLSEGATATDLTGPDVQELNTDLVSLGYVTDADLSPTSDEFGYWTKVGVERLQAALGVAQNGSLALGQAVFLPTAARVISVSATLGASAPVGQSVMSATSTTRQVSIAVGAGQQSVAAVGDHVTITLPNNQITPGVISSVGTVATAPADSNASSSNGPASSTSTPTITVLVDPTDPAATGTWDQAPVNVTITTGSVSNALVVPVDALLAQSNGGYAVEVVDADGIHRLVPVTLGFFDDADGLVQVAGTSLTAGQQIVVPNL
jgi:hypothetical protein